MSDFQEGPSREGTRVTFFHVAVVILSLTLTLTAWQFSKRQVAKQTEIRFETSVDQTIGLIEDRMQKYEDALWSGVAAVMSHDGDISLEDWRTFGDALRIEDRYPGINGIGVIHFHTAQTLDPYLRDQREERPEFRVHPAHDAPIFMPITYIVPEDLNSAAIGLDVAHERNRRTAALASRDTGTAQITGPIVLVQDAERTPGFLFYAPFYEGEMPQTEDARRRTGSGAVYAPFVVHKLMEGLLTKELRDIRFSIADASEIIYNEHDASDPLFDPDPMFEGRRNIEIYGRTWVVDFQSNLAFRDNNSAVKPTFILIAGLLIESLIILLLFQMASANERSVAYADAVTAALRTRTENLAEANRNLSLKNEELEQFSYIASHDLKTPLRGIGGLAEMLEEDLEDYFASPDANPDVADNIGLIHDRVARMSDLIRSIMAYSQVATEGNENRPLPISDLLEELRLDLDLSDDQLFLRGDPVTFQEDTFNLRCVLENLITNAVKHHDGRDDIEVSVTTADAGDWIEVSVSDNGPGIDPQFHDRIFKVFQTLRTGDAPRSTGIGLSIVKKAVDRHGSPVTVTSRTGEGTTFSFSWPSGAAADAVNTQSRAA